MAEGGFDGWTIPRIWKHGYCAAWEQLSSIEGFDQNESWKIDDIDERLECAIAETSFMDNDEKTVTIT